MPSPMPTSWENVKISEALAFLDTLPSGMFDLPKGKPVVTGVKKRPARSLGALRGAASA